MAHRRLAAAAAAILVPFTFLGYGTDIDAANVLRAGRQWLDDRIYHPSRPPGTAIHEVAVAGLDRVGGSVAIALVSVGFGALALWAVAQLAEADGQRWPILTALVVFANPWFVIAATSMSDAVWAVAFALLGAVQAQRDRRFVAAVLFGVAIGCRGSTALLVVAWLVAERTGQPADRPSWAATLRTAGGTLVVGAICFVPAWLSTDRTLDFLDTHFEFLGWGSHLGRWFIKNLVVMTIPGAVALALAVPGLWSAVRRWAERRAVRFALVAIVLGELVFLRLPFKPIHLLPVVVVAALLVGAADRRRLLLLLIAAQLLGGVVGITIARPDVPDRATRGSTELHLTRGPLLNDVRCRLDDRERGPWPDPAIPAEEAAAQARATANFDCQSRAWRPRSSAEPEASARMGP